MLSAVFNLELHQEVLPVTNATGCFAPHWLSYGLPMRCVVR